MYLFNAIEKFLEKTVEKLENPEEIGKGPDYNSNAKRTPLGKGNSGHGHGGNRRGGKPARPRQEGGKQGGTRHKRHGNQGSKSGEGRRKGGKGGGNAPKTNGNAPKTNG